MTLTYHNQHKYDDTPITSKEKIYEGEGRKTAHNTYTTLIHKVFDYLMIPLFNQI